MPGFTRRDAPLSAIPQLSAPPTLSASALNAKLLRKAHGAGSVEAGFLDMFCNLLWGGGCGWPRGGACEGVLVGAARWSDARAVRGVCAAQVPTRARGRGAPETKRWLPLLFSHAALSGTKMWKREPMLNGCPYVLGVTPFVTGAGHELDSDCMLHARGGMSHEFGGVPKHVAQPPEGFSTARMLSDDTQDLSAELPMRVVWGNASRARVFGCQAGDVHLILAAAEGAHGDGAG
ncbi:hypothetical protein B0H11DRAFT_2378905 [Mycena galericulata]|nr:hypothetical protein B0H11DRAFT_2378905 [Mycena galericulata]